MSGQTRASSAAPLRATPLYRFLVFACRAIAGTLRIRLVLEGAENLPRDRDGRPAGGWIAAAFPHRTWVEPFVVLLLLPLEPRPVFFGEVAPVVRSPLRRWVFRHVGGVVTIPERRRASAFERHVEAARRTVTDGLVFTLFPEVGPPSPLGRARPFGGGIGYFALRSGAPIVPLVFGGSDELHLGRRLVMRALPRVTVRELAGIGPGELLPDPGSPAERDIARRVVAALQERTASDVADVQAEAEPRQPKRKHWRWLTRAFH